MWLLAYAGIVYGLLLAFGLASYSYVLLRADLLVTCLLVGLLLLVALGAWGIWRAVARAEEGYPRQFQRIWRLGRFVAVAGAAGWLALAGHFEYFAWELLTVWWEFVPPLADRGSAVLLGCATFFGSGGAIAVWCAVRQWSLWRLAKRRWRQAEGKCEKCGYLLIGLTEKRCPECGTPFEAQPEPVA